MSQQEKSEKKSTDDDWELRNRCSCDYCLEPYDATDVIPRTLRCGHSCCESCIEKSKTANVFTCVCKIQTIIADVKDLPLNRPILTVSEFLNEKQAKKKSARTCDECGTEVDQKFFAVCKWDRCTKFQQLICLLCVNKKHKDHATSSFEEYIEEMRGECRLKLERQQHDLFSLCNTVYIKAGEITSRLGAIKKTLAGNEANQRILEQTSNLLDEKEAEELLEIGASLLDPFQVELRKTDDTLNSVLISLENTFGDGLRGDAELQPGEKRIGPVGKEEMLPMDQRTIRASGVDNRVTGQEEVSSYPEASLPLGEDNTVPAKEEENVIVMDLSEPHTLRVINCAEVRGEGGVYYKLRLALPSASHELRLLPGQRLEKGLNYMYSNFSIEERGHAHLLANGAEVIGSRIGVRGWACNFVYEGRGVARTRASRSSEWEKRSFKRIVMVTYVSIPWRALQCLSFIKFVTRNREDKTQLDIIFCMPNRKVLCKQEIDEAAKNADNVRVIYLTTPLKSLSSNVPQLEKPDEDTAILVVRKVDAAVFNQFDPNNVFECYIISPIQ